MRFLCCIRLTIDGLISNRRESNMCCLPTPVDGSASCCDMSNSFDEETALYQQETKAAVSNPKIAEFKTWIRFGRFVVSCVILVGIIFTVLNLPHEAIAVVAVMVVAFVAYDVFVQRKIAVILQQLARSDAIVSSLFPGNFHERLPTPDVIKENKQSLVKRLVRKSSTRTTLKEFIGDSEEFTSCADGLTSEEDHAPIADLYPETTIMLLDLVGFTAWSSAREPSAVFLLLESIFSAFDELAKRRHVFKVETVGDCYVAVAGLPNPRKDHALAMARFAKDCLRKFSVVTRKLECVLGPDTSGLAVRIGLHSGAITGGVLRGERARFQLFGDTINTAARMESNGEPNQIQMSETTAEHLRAAGKGHWLKKRDDLIEAKGKGAMQCYWLDIHASTAGTIEEVESINDDDEEELVADEESLNNEDLFLEERRLTRKQERLVDWNTTCLFQLCKQIHQNNTGPQIEDTAFMLQVRKELRSFVYCIALKYNNNPFHNFEHASHVTMSVIKLLGRICDSNNFQSESEKHSKTFGIASDSLTQFAVVFAALIHDVDHSGVPNATLVDEQNPLAEQYNGQSIAEHHSIAVAWDLLMRDEYAHLRTAIGGSSSDNGNDDVDKTPALLRFRQVVESAVLATDIVDSKVMASLESRLATKYDAESLSQELKDAAGRGKDDDVNYVDRITKEWHAKTVIECLVQASDVSHTMQHWHVYLKFTELFFKERFMAWKNGRAQSDPGVGWVESELGFFDNYVIPLAETLNSAGVFGAAGIQYLDFARENRKELERKGEKLVQEFRERSETDFMAVFLQSRDGVPEPTSLSFRISEGSSVVSNVSGSTVAAASIPPDFSFRISDQFGPGPGNLFLSKEWSLRDLSLGPRPPKTKSKLPTPYIMHFK